MPDAVDRLEIESSRTMQASPEQVFEAFRNPELLRQWWGPDGFTNTVESFDFRPGGEWRIRMTAPDGAVYDNEWLFQEIQEPERIVAVHLRPGHDFQLCITLTPEATDRCLVTWVMVFTKDVTENEKLKSFLEKANAENLARLDALITA